MSRPLLALLVTIAGATVASPSPVQARMLAFKSPSGNITCVMSTSSGTFAQCELRSMPRRGGFVIPPGGEVRRYDVASEDDLAHRRFVLRYGDSRQLGRYRCTSRESGMTCRNRRRGHGFSLSRQRQRTW